MIDNYEFFQLRRDARDKFCFTTIHKCIDTLRQFAYDITTDASYKSLKMFERMGQECAYLFCEYVVDFYGDIYLRKPSKSDVERLYVAQQARHGFQGMFSSIDYMRHSLRHDLTECI